MQDGPTMPLDHYPLIIGGKETDAASGQRFETVDPATGEALATVARADAADVDAAVRAARRALHDAWRPLPAVERARLLRTVSDLLAARSDELARLESLDSGKPLTQARTDVAVAARYFEFYAGVADKLLGETIPISPDLFAYTVQEPYGVTGHIVPWNYPIQIASRTIAPALAAGNCCVLKPAEETPLTAVVLGRLALEAGLPPGVLNVVPGFGEEAGAALTAHPGVDYLVFTGSPEVGRLVMRSAAEHITPVGLELGGKSPHLVLADADIDAAIPFIVRALIQNAGQTCSAGSRVIVDRRIEDDLVSALAEAFGRVSIGRGIDDPDLGPLVSHQQLQRVLSYIERGRTDGATLTVGGQRVDRDDLAAGCFVAPTMFTDVQPDQAVAQDEIFGPVLSVLRFHDVAEALRIANATRFGLVSAVWTRDIDRALWLAGQLESGQVFINTYGAGGGVELPFGGWKESGFGREKGLHALHEYSQLKTVAVRIRAPQAPPQSGSAGTSQAESETEKAV
jgi:aldehyde dehydrogenase (NAD+)